VTLRKEVTQLALPAILHSLLQTLVFVVDRVMLGHHAKTSLAAMQIAGPLEWSTMSVFLAFEIGTIARVGRLVGKGDKDAARTAAVVSLVMAIAIGSAVALVGRAVIWALPLGFRDASPETIHSARAYLSVTLGASPIVFVAAAATAILQASGDTRTPLAIGVFANVIHVALNRVLILGAFGVPALGPLGCGISTAFTFTIEAGIAVWVLQAGTGRVSLRGPQTSMREEARAIGRVSWPAALERFLYHTGFTAHVVMLGWLGDTAMAANQALISIESICFLSADGFGVAAAALVAQKLGAGKPDEARGAARIAAAQSAAMLTTLGLLAFAAKGVIVPLFTDDPGVATMGIGAMWVLALAQPAMAVGIVLAQALRGAGETRSVLAVTSVGVLVIRLSTTWLFAFHAGLGLVGVWLGSTCDWFVRTSLLVPLVARRLTASGSARDPAA
jgi:putative MATE family efflux protein